MLGYDPCTNLQLTEDTVTRARHRPWLLASDLDGTLIPSDGSRAGAAAVAEIAELVGCGSLRLAYVTGRHLSLALSGIEREALPIPEALATDVGTSLYVHRDGAFLPHRGYEAFLRASFSAPDQAGVRAALDGWSPRLTPQEDSRQARFKVSYYYDGDLTEEVLDGVSRRLSDVGPSRIVHSRDPVSGRGLLDVLPEGVGKETVVRFLMSGLEGDAADLLFAGDSGNDRGALLSGARAIVVGNAREPLKAELRRGAAERGIEDRVYFASATYADGVLEGLDHHGAPRCS